MWPKAVAQLIELAPHLARMLPMADRFFQSKSAEQEANRLAMQQLSDDLGGQLSRVTAAHDSLYRQLNDHTEKLTTLTTDLRATRLTTQANEARLIALEARTRILLTLLCISILLSLTLLALAFIHH